MVIQMFLVVQIITVVTGSPCLGVQLEAKKRKWRWVTLLLLRLLVGEIISE